MRWAAAVLAAAFCAGCNCGGSSGPDAGMTATVGPEGGTLSIDGLTLTFPSGALSSQTEIQVFPSELGAPEVTDRVRISKVYLVLPDTLQLLIPATVSIQYLPEDLPRGIPARSSDVRRLSFTRAMERLSSIAVDSAAQVVSGETLALGTFWATAPAGPRPVTIKVTPESQAVSQGSTVQYSAEVRDQNDRLMPGYQVDWSTSDPSAATIDQTGKASAVGAGVVTVTAKAGAAQGKATLMIASTDPFPSNFVWENPLPQGNALYAAKADATRLAIAGAGGTLMVQDGPNWTPLYSSAGLVLTDVSLVPGQVVAVGSRSGQGALVRWDGQHAAEQAIPDTALKGIWSDGTLGLAAGDGPNVALLEGGAWTVAPSPVTEPLLAVDGTSGELVVAGARGAVYRRQGSAWIALNDAPLPQWQKAAAVRGQQAYAISETSLRHFDGSSWSVVALPATPVLTLDAVATPGTAVAVLGHDASGKYFALVDSGSGFLATRIAGEVLHGIWGRSASDLYAVGEGGALYHYGGALWSNLVQGLRGAVVAVAAFDGPEVVAAVRTCPDSACTAIQTDVLHRGADGKLLPLAAAIDGEPHAIAGSSASDFVVGTATGAWHYDGTNFSQIPIMASDAISAAAQCEGGLYLGGTSLFKGSALSYSMLSVGLNSPVQAISCSGQTVFAVGSGTVIRLKGSGATRLDPAADGLRSAPWKAVFVMPDGQAFVGGDASYLLRWNGANFEAIDRPAGLAIASLHSLWGTGPGNIWGAGLLQDGRGFLMRFNGAFWSPVSAGYDGPMNAVSGLKSGELWVGGAMGTLLHGVLP